MYEDGDGDDDDDDDCDDKDDISSLIAEVERGCAPPTLNHGIDTEVGRYKGCFENENKNYILTF